MSICLNIYGWCKLQELGLNLLTLSTRLQNIINTRGNRFKLDTTLLNALNSMFCLTALLTPALYLCFLNLKLFKRYNIHI